MDSCISFPGHGENIQAQGDNSTIFPIRKRSLSRPPHSFSCSSSFESSSSFGSSSFDDSSPSSPIIPIPFSGIPFSWEQHPGIPKKYSNPHSKNKDGSDLVQLPLPPPPNNQIPSKRFNQEPILSTQKKNFHTDPFVAALVECSRDRRRDGLENCWKGTKVSRPLSDRLGFIDLYSSCKNSCTVSDSTVFVPRSSRGSYLLLNRRTG